MKGISAVTPAVHRFPLPEPESDGTLTWDVTVAVTVTLQAHGHIGLGWTYSSPAAAAVIAEHFAPAIVDWDPLDISGGWEAMHRVARNFGTRGLVMQALSAVDIAWWDLKARLLGVGLIDLFGAARDRVPIYGSGGFTSMSRGQLEQQVELWQSIGCHAMKIKIGEGWGSNPGRDLDRVDELRQLAGDAAELMVDANGAYSSGAARRMGAELDDRGVVWFEEPVSSDDLTGLAATRAAVRCDVAAGEYAADVYELSRLMPVVDCVQLDATRCGGYTGFLTGAGLASSHNLPVSAHCAPALHAPVAAAISNLKHIEWFADHARLEPALVDGAPQPVDAHLNLDRSTLGHGMTLRGGST